MYTNTYVYMYIYVYRRLVKGIVDIWGMYHIFSFLFIIYDWWFSSVSYSFFNVYSRQVRAGPVDCERGRQYLGVSYFLILMYVL